MAIRKLRSGIETNTSAIIRTLTSRTWKSVDEIADSIGSECKVTGNALLSLRDQGLVEKGPKRKGRFSTWRKVPTDQDKKSSKKKKLTPREIGLVSNAVDDGDVLFESTVDRKRSKRKSNPKVDIDDYNKEVNSVLFDAAKIANDAGDSGWAKKIVDLIVA